MLQKELAKRLKARYDTKMDGSGWLEVSSDGIPLCRIKYNGQFLSNADQNLSDESKALGSRTVMSGSVSRSKNDPSQSLQMIERPLLTPDELKSLPKGDFIVMKTGVHPMRIHLKLFFKWGIEFDDEHPYAVPDQGNREVRYADKKEIQDGILEKYPPEWKEEMPAPSDADGGSQVQQASPKNEPQRTQPKDKNRGGSPIRTSPPKKETAPDRTEAEIIKDLTETEVQSNEPS